MLSRSCFRREKIKPFASVEAASPACPHRRTVPSRAGGQQGRGRWKWHFRRTAVHTSIHSVQYCTVSYFAVAFTYTFGWYRFRTPSSIPKLFAKGVALQLEPSWHPLLLRTLGKGVPTMAAALLSCSVLHRVGPVPTVRTRRRRKHLLARAKSEERSLFEGDDVPEVGESFQHSSQSLIFIPAVASPPCDVKPTANEIHVNDVAETRDRSGARQRDAFFVNMRRREYCV